MTLKRLLPVLGLSALAFVLVSPLAWLPRAQAQAGGQLQIPAGRPTSADVTDAPFWAEIKDIAAFEQASSSHLAHAEAKLAQLVAVTGPRTIENTLQPYDDIAVELNLAEQGAGVITRLHADEHFRLAATKVLTRIVAFQNSLQLNRRVYDALNGLNLSSADAETRYYVTRELATLRLSGADKDDATRARLNELRQQHESLNNDFRTNIRDGVKKFSVPREQLDGMPADFVARLKVDESGQLELTSGDADARQVLTYAKSDELRRRMYIALNTVGWPANEAVLRRILTTRAEIAKLTGHANFAEWDMPPRMARTTAAASGFIDRVVAAAGPKATTEFAALLKRKQQDTPGATSINAWESSYYSELLRRERYAFDSLKLREYFPFDQVKKGVMEVTSTLFGVTFRPVSAVPVWEPSVEVYELLENGRVLGRFYFDLHPRPNKAVNGALATLIRKGMAGRQITEIALVGAFAKPTPANPGLMSNDEVKLFFHEFGHVVQNILASQHTWFGTSGTPLERDFNEGPSQLLEEWAMDPKTLATFGRHYQTGQPVPADLVAQARRSAEFGQGLFVRSQMVYARLTLAIHQANAATIDPASLIWEIQKDYVPYTFITDTHFESRFTQLVNPNYWASYYTYMWSLVIAKDLFTKFDRDNLLAPAAARRYRDTVLVPGASKPADALIQDFLGRPFNFAAWEAWLNSGG